MEATISAWRNKKIESQYLRALIFRKPEKLLREKLSAGREQDSSMEPKILQKLANKSMTKKELLQKVEQNFELFPQILNGVHSPKASIRYGCAKVLMDLSETHPEKLYPFMDTFIKLLESKYRILTWNAMTKIANLAKVDKDNKIDSVFEEYYSFLNDEYMVTVANVIGNSTKIASAKPYMIKKITDELLKVENISLTPHLTEECRRVIIEKAVKFFSSFFDKIEQKEKVVSFAKRQVNSPRRTLSEAAEDFLIHA